MIGGSYGGQIQFATAAVDPRVDTIVPLITWNDLRYSLAPEQHQPHPRRHLRQLHPGHREDRAGAALFFGVGIADGLQGAAIDPTRNVGCPNFAARRLPGQGHRSTRSGYPTRPRPTSSPAASVGALHRARSRSRRCLIQGENDTLFNLQEAIATYRSLQAQRRAR